MAVERGKKGERIIALAQDGNSPRRITELMAGHRGGRPSVGSVRTVISRARRAGVHIPPPVLIDQNGPALRVELHDVKMRPELIAKLGRAARAHDMPIGALAGKLVEMIVADNIVDAVLDGD